MLSSFSLASLQEAVTIIQILENSGITTLEDAANKIESIIADSGVVVDKTTNETYGVSTETDTKRDMCPSCGMAYLYICSQTSALVGRTVRVCGKHCGYSEVVNG